MTPYKIHGYGACPRRRRRRNPRSRQSAKAKWQRPVDPEEKSFLARRPLIYLCFKGAPGLGYFPRVR
jgi:hypothetical protein